ncbi:MAG: hypothetical protein KTR14_07315 [Vampirovibrio sp.]|nr:hypothetical protein [Vampirovibrio sp.]
MDLRIAHLYPDLLNIYGDRGNILTLYQRCQWRGISVTITPLSVGDNLDPAKYDLYFIGGGQDMQQIKVCDDLLNHKRDGILQAVETQAVFLAICGGYQLFGHYYQPHEGDRLQGLSIISAHTIAGHKRLIGNVSLKRPDGTTLVGFENHSGQTFLGQNTVPLGAVMEGYGNNGEDHLEGAVCGNVYGTYLHGSLLPKNPLLADELILKALSRRHGPQSDLPPLTDTLEHQAHQKALTFKS